jgi:Flp pilus assembly pilin Flp
MIIRARKGITNIEYVLIAAIVSVALVAAFQVMGDLLSPVLGQVAELITPCSRSQE